MYTIEMFLEWSNTWVPIAIDMAYRQKRFATIREAIRAIDLESRKYKGYHHYRVMKGNQDIIYKGVKS